MLEIALDDDGGTYRVIYAVGMRQAVYVVHAFMKKAKSGISMPAHEITTVNRRL